MEIEKFLISKWFLTNDFSELDPKTQKKIEYHLGPLSDDEHYVLISGTPKGFMVSEAPYVVLTNKRLLNINAPTEILQCLYSDITELSMKPTTIVGLKAAVVPTVTIHGTSHAVLTFHPVATMTNGFQNRVWTALRENWMKSKSQ